MDGKIIGQRIQALRKSQGITQEKLAEAAEMSVNYLSNIENGHDICGTHRLLLIANTLHASMDYLLGDNLLYNRLPYQGETYEALLHAISRMDADEQARLLKYIRFTQAE